MRRRCRCGTRWAAQTWQDVSLSPSGVYRVTGEVAHLHRWMGEGLASPCQGRHCTGFASVHHIAIDVQPAPVFTHEMADFMQALRRGAADAKTRHELH